MIVLTLWTFFPTFRAFFKLMNLFKRTIWEKYEKRKNDEPFQIWTKEAFVNSWIFSILLTLDIIQSFQITRPFFQIFLFIFPFSYFLTFISLYFIFIFYFLKHLSNLWSYFEIVSCFQNHEHFFEFKIVFKLWTYFIH